MGSWLRQRTYRRISVVWRLSCWETRSMSSLLRTVLGCASSIGLAAVIAIAEQPDAQPPNDDRSAHAGRHWAFEPIQRLSPPPDSTGWSDQAIDRFVLAGLREHGLEPAGPVNRLALARRAYFD